MKSRRKADEEMDSRNLAGRISRTAFHTNILIIKDVVYLSHMNLMYDLYEKEENLKRIEHEYDIITDKYQDLSKIMEIIRVNKRMDFEVILKEENIAREDLDELLMRNEKYFNIRKQRSKVKISLSPEGRKYLYYLENRKVKPW